MKVEMKVEMEVEMEVEMNQKEKAEARPPRAGGSLPPAFFSFHFDLHFAIGNCDPQSGIAQILARRRRLYRPLKGLYRRCIYR